MDLHEFHHRLTHAVNANYIFYLIHLYMHSRLYLLWETEFSLVLLIVYLKIVWFLLQYAHYVPVYSFYLYSNKRFFLH